MCDEVDLERGVFLSTPSARRATQAHRRRDQDPVISIHALREEGDQNPCPASGLDVLFLSTPSARRATRVICPDHIDVIISIHALREEGDEESKD